MTELESMRIAVGSVAPTVIRATRAEALLTGRLLNEDAIQAAMGMIESEVSPIDDMRSTAHYRSVVTGNILRRLLRQIVGS